MSPTVGLLSDAVEADVFSDLALASFGGWGPGDGGQSGGLAFVGGEGGEAEMGVDEAEEGAEGGEGAGGDGEALFGC